MRVDDLVVVKDDKSKHLVRVLKLKPLSGVLESSRADEPKYVDFDEKQVLVNLGAKPMFGSVYGCKVEWMRSRHPHEAWGQITVMRDLSKVERKVIREALDNQLALRKRLRLPAPTYIKAVELRENSGKWAGKYAFRPRDSDVMQLMPKSFAEVSESQGVVKPNKWLPYLIAHEDAHGLWYRYCTPKMHARWINLYHSTVMLSRAEPDAVRNLGKAFFKSRASKQEFASDLTEEDGALFDSCIGWITNYHSLSQRNLDVLFADNPSNIKQLWPREAIFETDHEIPLGEYASVSPEECFAEAFALKYAGGMKLPKAFDNLMEKTIEALPRIAKTYQHGAE